jgi:hypothetical protein
LHGIHYDQLEARGISFRGVLARRKADLSDVTTVIAAGPLAAFIRGESGAMIWLAYLVDDWRT